MDGSIKSARPLGSDWWQYIQVVVGQCHMIDTLPVAQFTRQPPIFNITPLERAHSI